MATKKYLNVESGKIKQKTPTVTSTGSGQGGDIVALDSGGKLDLSVLPSGVGPEIIIATASGALEMGEFVNIYLNAGVCSARKASASPADVAPAHGFVLNHYDSGDPTVNVYTISQNNNKRSGLTVGADYYLSASSAGSIVSTAPSGAGELVQYIGTAHATDSIILMNTLVVYL